MKQAEKRKVAAALLRAANVLEASVEVDYQRRRKNIDQLMKKAHGLLRQHRKRAEEFTDWGYVGDLTHVEKLLKQVVDFLSSSEG